VCLCYSHCVSGVGLGSSPLTPDTDGDDNALSPETCYECKINGYPKRGRKRRGLNETEEHQQHIQVYLQLCIWQTSLSTVTCSALHTIHYLSACVGCHLCHFEIQGKRWLAGIWFFVYVKGVPLGRDAWESYFLIVLSNEYQSNCSWLVLI